jgi:transcriptional regulator GlxA family with amidase domain
MTIKELTSEELRRVAVAATLLTQDFKHRLTTADLAKRVKLSEKKLLRGFHEQFDCGVFEYFQKERLKKVKEMLLEDFPLRTIADEIGFADKSAVSKKFRKKLDAAPSKWLQSVRGSSK